MKRIVPALLLLLGITLAQEAFIEESQMQNASTRSKTQAQPPQDEPVESSPRDLRIDRSEDAEPQQSKDIIKRIRDDRYFFQTYRTLTNTNVVLTTSTVFLSCLRAISTSNNCTGRRKKRSILKKGLIEPNRRVELDSSHSEHVSALELEEGNKQGRAAFTIWTAVATTTTVTTVYTDSSTTVSLSYQCSVGLLSVPDIVCSG